MHSFVQPSILSAASCAACLAAEYGQSDLALMAPSGAGALRSAPVLVSTALASATSMDRWYWLCLRGSLLGPTLFQDLPSAQMHGASPCLYSCLPLFLATDFAQWSGTRWW